MVLPVGWLVLLTLHGAFRRTALEHPLAALRAVVPALGSLTLVIWVGVFAGAVDPTSPFLLAALGAVVAGTLGSHLLVAACSRRERLVLVGDPGALARVLPRIADRRSHHLDLVGLCLTGPGSVPGWDLPAQRGLDRLEELVLSERADVALVLPGDDLDPAVVRRAAWGLEHLGVDLVVGTPLVDVARRRTVCTAVGGWSAVHVQHVARRGPAGAVRAVLDRVVAAFLLLLLLPLLGAITMLVRWDSPGPAVFRQVRVGQGGRVFTMLKFRTMEPGAERRLRALAEANETDGGPLFKIRADPRVTRVGRLLRRYSLDELPQLVNVLRGEMSLVGPRPALPREVEQYDADARRRLHVRPGLTGLWQVSGRSDLSWEESVRLDVAYVDNWSLGLDAVILSRTLHAVLRHRGAY